MKLEEEEEEEREWSLRASTAEARSAAFLSE